MRWVFFRLLRLYAGVVIIAFGVYGIDHIFDENFSGAVIGLGTLFFLPFTLGAIGAFWLTSLGRIKGSKSSMLLFLMFGLPLLSLVVLREGFVCILMLMPIWLIGIILGVLCVENLYEKFERRSRLKCSALIALPILVGVVEGAFPPNAVNYSVERSIIINSTPEDVWPLLAELDNISLDEGQWTFAQNIMGIPRPVSATITLKGEQAIRYAQWGESITFEEHIYSQVDHESLRWTFEFPNDSVHRYTDRHISPDGAHLKIQTGGYQLRALPDGQTLLTLDTHYQAATAINGYAALWGELILGGIQDNILTIVKTRAESMPAPIFPVSALQP